MKQKMKVKGNIECKFLTGKAGVLRLRRRSGTLRRSGNFEETYFDKEADFKANNDFSDSDIDSADKNAKLYGNSEIKGYGAENAESYLTTSAGFLLKYSPKNNRKYTLVPHPEMPSDEQDPNRVNKINPQFDPNIRYIPYEENKDK